MIIVFDTNIWIQHLYLRAPAGAATRFFIGQKGASVALPEVVRLEVEHHLRKNLHDFISKIKDNHQKLLAVFGTLKEIILPSEDEVEQKVSEAFNSLGVALIDVPFTLESARNSFLKTINKKPPSDKSQQFKDGVIWADCLSLLTQDEVVLVTDDKAFYEGRQHSSGIAAALRAELTNQHRNLKLFPGLPELLREIRSEVSIDHDALTRDFMARTERSTGRLLQRNGFQLGERTSLKAELFVTEDPTVLFLEFAIAFRCNDISGVERGDGMLEIRGDGFYNSDTHVFSRLGELGTELRFRDVDGSEQLRRNIAMRAAGIVLGHRDVSHVVRNKLT
jgi:hypothetical protein